jgi:hypothetical protein
MINWIMRILDDELWYTLALVYTCTMAFGISFIIAYVLV